MLRYCGVWLNQIKNWTGAFCQFTFFLCLSLLSGGFTTMVMSGLIVVVRHYCNLSRFFDSDASNESTGKKNGKTHFCGPVCCSQLYSKLVMLFRDPFWDSTHFTVIRSNRFLSNGLILANFVYITGQKNGKIYHCASVHCSVPPLYLKQEFSKTTNFTVERPFFVQWNHCSQFCIYIRTENW